MPKSMELPMKKNMQNKLAEMPEVLRQSRALVSGDIEGELDRILTHLKKDTGWKNDKSKKPNLAMKRDIDPLHKAIARYAGTVDTNDAKLKTLKQKMSEIEKIDPASDAATETAQERRRSRPAGGCRMSGQTILVADDDAAIRTVLDWWSGIRAWTAPPKRYRAWRRGSTTGGSLRWLLRASTGIRRHRAAFV